MNEGLKQTVVFSCRSAQLLPLSPAAQHVAGLVSEACGDFPAAADAFSHAISLLEERQGVAQLSISFGTVNNEAIFKTNNAQDQGYADILHRDNEGMIQTYTYQYAVLPSC